MTTKPEVTNFLNREKVIMTMTQEYEKFLKNKVNNDSKQSNKELKDYLKGIEMYEDNPKVPVLIFEKMNAIKKQNKYNKSKIHEFKKPTSIEEYTFNLIPTLDRQLQSQLEENMKSATNVSQSQPIVTTRGVKADIEELFAKNPVPEIYTENLKAPSEGNLNKYSNLEKVKENSMNFKSVENSFATFKFTNNFKTNFNNNNNSNTNNSASITNEMIKDFSLGLDSETINPPLNPTSDKILALTKTWNVVFNLKKKEIKFGPFSSILIYTFLSQLEKTISSETNERQIHACQNILIEDITDDLFYIPSHLLDMLNTFPEIKNSTEIMVFDDFKILSRFNIDDCKFNVENGETKIKTTFNPVSVLSFPIKDVLINRAYEEVNLREVKEEMLRKKDNDLKNIQFGNFATTFGSNFKNMDKFTFSSNEIFDPSSIDKSTYVKKTEPVNTNRNTNYYYNRTGISYNQGNSYNSYNQGYNKRNKY